MVELTWIVFLRLGFLRLGFLDAVLSRALMRGFITAVGLVILLSQTISILGLDQLLSKQHGASSTVPEKLVFLLTHLKHTHKLTVLVSANAAAILIGMKVVKSRLKGRKKASWIRFVPEVLLVVIGATRESSFIVLLSVFSSLLTSYVSRFNENTGKNQS